jgi:tRNA pseudouridine32 synthase/23S rRNA pseudouridine746 synthase
MTNEPYIVKPCTDKVETLYTDEDLLLVNKPSGLLSVPGKHPANKDCLATRVQQQYPSARIVHRLDMDTSGIMVLALNTDSHRALSRLFAERKVTKEYEANVFGTLSESRRLIDLPLICDWPNRPRQKVDFQHGKSAQTWVQKVSQHADGWTRLLLTPVTGRSHQLRVHLAEIGHPILGCEFYAHPQAVGMANRLQLHATKLEFAHPNSGEKILGISTCPFQ